MNSYVSIALELSVGFLAFFLYTKLLGKTHFSQLTPFDFISALILGDLLGNAVYDPEVDVWRILFATGLWASLIVTIVMITQKFKTFRKTLEGEPSILIRAGQIKYETMKRNKIDINQLQSLIRQQGYFSMGEIDYAILETNGAISVLPKPKHDNPTLHDLGLHRKSSGLPVTLILDGEVIYDNLQEAGVDEQWLKKQLQQNDISSVKEVLYAEWNADKPLYINKY